MTWDAEIPAGLRRDAQNRAPFMIVLDTLQQHLDKPSPAKKEPEPVFPWQVK